MKCKNCGGCCGNLLPLSKSEIAVMKSKAEELNNKPLNNHYLSCPFLTPLNLCSIYEVRPDICRVYHCDSKERKPIRDFNKKIVDIRKEVFNQGRKGWIE